MEPRMRDFLEKAFRKFGSHFNSARFQAPPVSQTQLVEGSNIPQGLPTDKTALTQTSSLGSLSSGHRQFQLQEQPLEQPPLQSVLDAQLVSLEPEIDPTTNTSPNHTIPTQGFLESNIRSEHELDQEGSCPVLPLTEEIVAQMVEVLRAVRKFERLESSCESARRKAREGRSFMDFAEAQREDEDCPRRDWYLEELERRAPHIQADIQRLDTLEEGLQNKRRDLDHSRNRLESTLEGILIDKQLYKSTDAEENLTLLEDSDAERRVSVRSADGHSRANTSAEGSLFHPYRPAYDDATAYESEDPYDAQVRERYEAALRNVRMLQGLFDRKDQDNEEGIQRYREALRIGEVDFPESEVRKLHLQQDRELLQSLMGGEMELQEALEDYRAYGFQTEDDMSIMSYRENDGEPYSSDPGELAATTATQDHSRVAMWLEQIAELQQEDVAQPDVDPWGDDKSVSISSTFSMVEKDPSNRKQIDYWRLYCSTFRTTE